jgi:hypothetical protein
VSDVDLVLNVWERTYREVLSGGPIEEIAQSNRHPFARRVVLINNVEDRAQSDALARALVERGEIDDFVHVADRLDHALAVTGLTRDDLGKMAHYSDCALVAVTLEGAPWIVYWDVDVRLAEPHDWITPSIAMFERDPRVMVANPAFVDPTLEPEARERHGDFVLGDGFSDQLFLARRSELAAPIYRQRCLAQLRFPMAHLGAVFEARIDAWMRHNGRLRATYLPATYIHPSEGAGTSYPTTTGVERVKAFGVRAGLALLRATPRRLRPDHLRTVV